MTQENITSPNIICVSTIHPIMLNYKKTYDTLSIVKSLFEKQHDKGNSPSSR